MALATLHQRQPLTAAYRQTTHDSSSPTPITYRGANYVCTHNPQAPPPSPPPSRFVNLLATCTHNTQHTTHPTPKGPSTRIHIKSYSVSPSNPTNAIPFDNKPAPGVHGHAGGHLQGDLSRHGRRVAAAGSPRTAHPPPARRTRTPVNKTTTTTTTAATVYGPGVTEGRVFLVTPPSRR